MGTLLKLSTETIDSFCFSIKMLPNMYSTLFTVFALPRTRRPEPTSLRRLGVFCFDGGINAMVR